jgi:hypothetical protein
MLQFPSNWAAIAGGAEQMIAKTVERAKAPIRLRIMESSYVSCALINSSCPGGEAVETLNSAALPIGHFVWSLQKRKSKSI